jgi:hypothetical protein
MAGDGHLERHLIHDRKRDDGRRRNAKILGIGTFAIALILFTMASILMLNSVFRYFEMREDAKQAQPAGSNIDARSLPPEPRLQDHAVQDLRQMRAAEDRILSSYQWIDQKKGIVRIPIDRAMDLVANGWHSRGTAHRTPDDRRKLNVPAESGIASIESAVIGPDGRRSHE